MSEPRVVYLTGGAQGIGLGIAEHLLARGDRVALTHALAVSLGPEVRVNAISPGWIEVGDWQKAANRVPVKHREIDRDQHPVGRAGRPEDIAAMAAFLLSDQAGFITGQNLVVDGGMTRRMIYAE